MMINNYELLFHNFFIERVTTLIHQVEKLKKLLPQAEYQHHEATKLLKRIIRACKEIIPQNPNHPDYYLRGPLSKFRRYKKGIQRFRLLFCFSNKPPIIPYLYLNDANHLRADGSKNDPYAEFHDLVKKGVFSHNTSDAAMKKWYSKTLDL